MYAQNAVGIDFCQLGFFQTSTGRIKKECTGENKTRMQHFPVQTFTFSSLHSQLCLFVPYKAKVAFLLVIQTIAVLRCQELSSIPCQRYRCNVSFANTCVVDKLQSLEVIVHHKISCLSVSALCSAFAKLIKAFISSIS